MTTKQIEYLVELAHLLNFNKAAQNLFISQPTLSYQIKEIENEVGFLIFYRNGKSISLTPAGRKFCDDMTKVKQSIKDSIEQAQNISCKYDNEIKIGLRYLTSLKKLPEVIIKFSESHPNVSITPYFDNELLIEHFLHGDFDCIFALEEQVINIPNITLHHLYDADICLVCRKDDPLAQKELIKPFDLESRTLMVGGTSSHTLQLAQQSVIRSVNVNQLNSINHNTTVINVLSNKAICLSPTYYQEENDSLAWLPFSFDKKIPCVLCTKDSILSSILKDFVDLLTYEYKNN